jgi:hypothetical protein
VGDERLKNMELVVLKPQNIPKQLHLPRDCPLMHGCPLISGLPDQAYETDLLTRKIFAAIRMNGSMKDITVPECTE